MSVANDMQVPPADEVAPVLSEIRDPRPRWRRMAGPVVGLGLLAGASVLVARVDPNEPGFYPPCPTQALFGIDCPGCGGLRCAHALLTGDVAGAASNNLFVVMLVPIIAVWLALTLWRAWSGRIPAPSPSRDRAIVIVWTVLGVIGIAFTVIRNIPGFDYLASGAG